MTLLTLLLILLGLGAAAWLVYKAPFIGQTFKDLINFVLIVVAVVFVLKFFGVFSAIAGTRIGN